MKRECDIVTAAGVVKDIGGLISSTRSASAVRCSQRHYSLVIHIEKFPVKFRLQGSSAASYGRGSKQSRKLLANFLLLAQQSIYFVARTNQTDRRDRTAVLQPWPSVGRSKNYGGFWSAIHPG